MRKKTHEFIVLNSRWYHNFIVFGSSLIVIFSWWIFFKRLVNSIRVYSSYSL